MRRVAELFAVGRRRTASPLSAVSDGDRAVGARGQAGGSGASDGWVGPDIITYDPGIDGEEEWHQSWEGKDHGVGISLIHLSTTRHDEGPPLHRHPYPETIIVRRGSSTVVVGDRELEAREGMTVIVPADTPHTFRTQGPQRYESVAIHASPEFLSTGVER